MFYVPKQKDKTNLPQGVYGAWIVCAYVWHYNECEVMDHGYEKKERALGTVEKPASGDGRDFYLLHGYGQPVFRDDERYKGGV